MTSELSPKETAPSSTCYEQEKKKIQFNKAQNIKEHNML